MVGTPLLLIIAGVVIPSSAIVLLCPAIFWDGAQSVTADRDARRSDGSDKYKGVREQYITEYK